MPKQVDHQARRQEIADAVLRLAASQGLDAVTLRHVAAEAGVSMGRVQHYFATKDEMLLFAFQVISERYDYRRSTVITTNRLFKDWTQVFPDPLNAQVIAERLTERGEHFVLEKNYRAQL